MALAGERFDPSHPALWQGVNLSPGTCRRSIWETRIGRLPKVRQNDRAFFTSFDKNLVTIVMAIGVDRRCRGGPGEQVPGKRKATGQTATGSISKEPPRGGNGPRTMRGLHPLRVYDDAWPPATHRSGKLLRGLLPVRSWCFPPRASERSRFHSAKVRDAQAGGISKAIS